MSASSSTPAVELFSTSILSNHKVRSRHERYTGVFAIKKIPYIYHDLASDEDAKTRWRRKTKDPQLPGILVNNEWRGTYEEFEEAVEFGELEMFLGIDSSSTPSAPPTQPEQPRTPTTPQQETQSGTAEPSAVHAAQRATSSKDPSLYPTIQFAPEGSGKRAEQTANDFIASLGLADDSLTEADADLLLASIGTPEGIKAAQAPKKAFTPSPEAIVKPLRLARMGKGAGASEGSSSSSSRIGGSPVAKAAGVSPRSPPIARYSLSQRSGKALAAEASALVTNRKTSGALLREAVSRGQTLDDAMEQSKIKELVSNEDLDHLFASLGLGDVDLAEDEAEAFLEGGEIPEGLGSGGSRLTRSSTKADKVRDEAAAREVAQRAREKGFKGSATGATVATSSTSAQEAGVPAATSDVKIAGDNAETGVDDDGDAAKAPARASLAQSAEIAETEPTHAGEAPAEIEAIHADEATAETASHDELTGTSSASAAAKVAEVEAAPTGKVEEEDKEAQPGKPNDVAAPVEIAPDTAAKASAGPTEAIALSINPASDQTTGESSTKVPADIVSQPRLPLEKDMTNVASGRSEAVSAAESPRVEAAEPTSAAGTAALTSEDKPDGTDPDSGQLQDVASPAAAATAMSLTAEAEPTAVAVAGTETKKTVEVEQSAARGATPAASATSSSLAQKEPDTAPVAAPPANTVTLNDTESDPVLQPDDEVVDPVHALQLLSSRDGEATQAASQPPTTPSSKTISTPASASVGTATKPTPPAVPIATPSSSRAATSPHALSPTPDRHPSRRGIDVSRPNIPFLTSPSTPSPSASTSASTSPPTTSKKSRMSSFKPFSLHRDRDRDRDEDKTRLKSPAASKSSFGAALAGDKARGTAVPKKREGEDDAPASRRQRTISQILREADAVLGVGDGYGSESGEEAEAEADVFR